MADTPEEIATNALERLRRRRVLLEPGLSDSEVGTIEDRFAFRFGPDQLALLTAAVPTGNGWPPWRDLDALTERFGWPLEGMLFDIEHNSFWPRSWGEKPSDDAEAERIARLRFQDLPVLVPIYSHRYLPAAPFPSGSPVFSVHQTDVIIYGDNLAFYIADKFGTNYDGLTSGDAIHVPFWGDLSFGADDDDL